jgi:hypothetical protein
VSRLSGQSRRLPPSPRTISTTFCKALVDSSSQVSTQPPVRPGANPSTDPRPSVAVDEAGNHGSASRIPSSQQRRDQTRHLATRLRPR